MKPTFTLAELGDDLADELGARLAYETLKARRVLTRRELMCILERAALRLCNALLAEGVPDSEVEEVLVRMAEAFERRLRLLWRILHDLVEHG